MRRDPLRFSRRLRWWFYSVFAALFISGAAWLAILLTQRSSDAESSIHPAQPTLMKLHGAAAMAALFLLGVLLPLHIRRGWKAGRNRSTGSVLIALCALLIVSGYALYYVGDEHTRHLSAVIHDALGVIFPASLAWHIVIGRKSRRAVPARAT